jgi:hypothetical protein
MSSHNRPSKSATRIASNWTTCQWMRFLLCFSDEDVFNEDELGSHERQKLMRLDHASRVTERKEPDFQKIRTDLMEIAFPVGRLAYPSTANTTCSGSVLARDIHCPLSDGGCGMTYWYLQDDVAPIIEHRGEFGHPVTVGLSVTCPCKTPLIVSEGSLGFIRIIPESRSVETTLELTRVNRERAESQMVEVKRLCDVGEISTEVFGQHRALKYFKRRAEYLKLKQFELTGMLTSMTEAAYAKQTQESNRNRAMTDKVEEKRPVDPGIQHLDDGKESR